MMRCSLQHVTWHGVLVWRQPDIKELLRQMQLIQATGSFWKKQSRQSLYGKKEGESVKVSLRGDGEELIAFTSRLCMEFPQINGQRSWKDLLMDMVDDFVLRGADGQLAA